MLELLLSYVAPHPCISCGNLGALLCDNCKYNIVCDSFAGCLNCGRLAGVNGVCKSCKVPYSRAWCVGERVDELHELIDRYKFERARSADKELATLLAEIIPVLPSNTVIIPVPTIRQHMRVRGYDHTYRIAQHLAKMKGVHARCLLQRRHQEMQRGASRQQRIKQARRAFEVREVISPNVPYLIIDDVVTTGSTLKYAAKCLAGAGAQTVWVAAVARQVSTKRP
jgi:competence protein ComFC